MLAGKLRYSMSILSPSTTFTAYGEPTSNWTTFASGVRCSYEPQVGMEYASSDTKEVQTRVDVKFCIRYRDGVLPNFRVSFRGQIYDILSLVNVNGDFTELDLYCKAVV